LLVKRVAMLSCIKFAMGSMHNHLAQKLPYARVVKNQQLQGGGSHKPAQQSTAKATAVHKRNQQL